MKTIALIFGLQFCVMASSAIGGVLIDFDDLPAGGAPIPSTKYQSLGAILTGGWFVQSGPPISPVSNPNYVDIQGTAVLTFVNPAAPSEPGVVDFASFNDVGPLIGVGPVYFSGIKASFYDIDGKFLESTSTTASSTGYPYTGTISSNRPRIHQIVFEENVYPGRETLCPIDDLVFRDVIGVPEPATLFLMIIGGVFLIRTIAYSRWNRWVVCSGCM